MQNTSELYKELLANGARREVRVEVSGEVYGEDRISSLFTTGSLFSSETLCAGSAVARQIDLVLKNYGTIPRMAKLVPSYRLVLGDQASEWIQKGVFYIDTRNPDKTSGTLTIHGFDDMLKGSVIWEPDQSLTFPMTFRKAAEVIAELMGVELDNPEDIDETYEIVDYPANDYTQRNILQFIAAAHAANFVMTDLGKLRMVGINDIPAETGYLVTENGTAIVFGGIRIKVADTAENNLIGNGEKVYVGGKVASTGAPPAFDPISKVIVKVDDKNAYFAGDNTGHVLEVACPYGTQAMADNILSKIKGFIYRPFTAEDAIVDQAIELGDGITVDGVYTILAQQEITFDGLMAGRVAAPSQQEVESEYPYQTKEQQVDLKIAQTRSLISKTASEIRLEVRGLDDKYTAVSVTLDGLTVTDSSGTTKIKGSSVETDTLYVNAANITGTLTANQVNLTGAITFSDLSSDVQNDINDAYSVAVSASDTASSAASTAASASSTANDAWYMANSANSTVGSWRYGSTTYIDGTMLMTGTVRASTLEGGSVALLSSGGYTVGYMTMQTTSSYGLTLESNYAMRLIASGGTLHLESGSGAIIDLTARIVCGSDICGANDATQYCGMSYARWAAVYASSGTINTSDMNYKHDIEDLPDKYLAMMDMIVPKRAKYNDGTSGRYHPCFIAQDVKTAMDACGIDSAEFGGWVKDIGADGNEIQMLRYDEFISILWAKIRQLENRVATLEGVSA